MRHLCSRLVPAYAEIMLGVVIMLLLEMPVLIHVVSSLRGLFLLLAIHKATRLWWLPTQLLGGGGVNGTAAWFFRACAQGRINDMRCLLAARPEIMHERDPENGWSALMWACVHKHATGLAAELVEKLADCEARDSEGHTPLLLACKNDCVATAHRLLAARAAVNVESHDGYTPLMHASRHGRTALVRQLIAAAGHVHKIEQAVSVALSEGHGETASCLIGFDPPGQVFNIAHVADNVDARPLIRAILQEDAEEIHRSAAALEVDESLFQSVLALASYFGKGQSVSGLLACKPSDRCIDGDRAVIRWTPLMLASARGHSSVVQHLLDAGANVEMICTHVGNEREGYEGATPLILASMAGHAAVVRELIQRGADPNNIANVGAQLTALGWASLNGHADVVEVLLTSTAVVVEPRDITPLCVRHPISLASRHGHSSVLTSLINKKVNIEYRCCLGRTPLIHASCEGHAKAVAVLLHARAQVDAQIIIEESGAQNSLRATALICATSRRNSHIVSMLLDAGANPDLQDETGKTALVIAVEHKLHTAVRDLVQAGAAIELCPEQGETALDIAKRTHQDEVAKMLQDAQKHVESRKAIHDFRRSFLAETGRCLLDFWSPRTRLASFRQELRSKICEVLKMSQDARDAGEVCSSMPSVVRLLGSLSEETLLIQIGEDMSCAPILDEIAGGDSQEAQRERASTAALHELDLHQLLEDDWGEHARERDTSRRVRLEICKLRLAVLIAKEGCLEQALRSLATTVDGSGPEGGAADTHDPDDAAAATRRSSYSTQVKAEDPMAAFFHDAIRRFDDSMRSQIREMIAATRSDISHTRLRLHSLLDLVQRRNKAESLLFYLRLLQAEIDEARRCERTALRRVEDKEEKSTQSDLQLARLKRRYKDSREECERLCQRRDELFRGKLPTVLGVQDVGAPSNHPENSASYSPSPFPELLVRAQRIVHPIEALETLEPAARVRFDMEILLRRAGLICERDKSYETSFKDVRPMTSGKPSVKRGTVRGSEPVMHKVLKEYDFESYKKIERAIFASRLLSHPGIVPIESAFIEHRSSVVVIQMPLYEGGNMREWCQQHDLYTRIRAAQRVAEAVRFLHTNDMLHRDIKPENVVFDRPDAEGKPALCDFDLSVNHATLNTTLMRGTLLYLAPETSPTKESDIFSLGILLLDALFCGCDSQALTRWLQNRMGSRCDAATLQRIQFDLVSSADRRQDENLPEGLREAPEGLPQLVSDMIALDQAARPNAAAVASRLQAFLDLQTCGICFQDFQRGNGVVCAEGHIACRTCLCDYVKEMFALPAVEERGEDGGHVLCFMARSHPPCGACFSLHDVARHTTALAFNMLVRNANQLRLNGFQRDLERMREDWEREWAHKGVADTARRTIEELSSESCPRCKQVYFDFVGCAALECANPQCKAAFCAFCHLDCGRNAHDHVRACPLNPWKEYFIRDWTVFERIRADKRSKQVRAYLHTLSVEVRQDLSQNARIVALLEEHGLVHELEGG